MSRARLAGTTGMSSTTASRLAERLCHPGRVRSGRHEPRALPPRPAAPLVELVFPALNSAWAMEVMRGVVDSGLDVVLSAPAGRGTSWAARVVEARRAGVLLVACPISASEGRVFARAGVPLVHFD
ncbi:LacI family transcriptional regulator, partial [Actinosynnema sp. NPDC023658]